MKSYALLIACTIIAGFSGNSFAALVGSPRPVAQENFQKLIKTNECPSCDLAGVVLTRVDLSGANLEGANLAGAKLYLTNLSGANLKNANLQGAKLGGADLAGADLRGANLTGAVLEGAYLKGAQIDGRIIADKPYETEDLPEVSEKKLIGDESRGKSVPYTQEVVIADRRDLGDAPPVAPQVQQEEPAVEPDMTTGSTAAPSKRLVPMADAVVHTPEPESPADVEEITKPVLAADEPAAEIVDDTDLWGTVTSFFSGSSADVEDEAEVVTSVDQESTAQVVDQPVDEIVVTEEAQPEPVQEIGSEEKVDDSGFWGSVTSIFSSDDAKEPGQEQVEKTAEEATAQPSQADEVAADTAVQTGKDELAPDAGVMAMIEQIEGPSPGSEEATVTDVPGQTAATDTEEVGSEGAEPAAGATVGDIVSQIEADQVPEAAPAGDMVYGVETPKQAKAKKQMYIDRLLDEDRCVDCDLAGVDLSGKNLDEVDLERANLQGANLEGIDLSEANLKGVNFSGANLKNADLREADLYLADFTGADLTGAKLEGALIDSADFTDATGANLDTVIKEE